MKKEIVVRLSAKQKLTNYKQAALTFINALKCPTEQFAFSVAGYQKTAGGMPKFLTSWMARAQNGRFPKAGAGARPQQVRGREAAEAKLAEMKARG